MPNHATDASDGGASTAADLQWTPDWDFQRCYICSKVKAFDVGSSLRMHQCVGGRMKRYTEVSFTGTDKEYYAQMRGNG